MMDTAIDGNWGKVFTRFRIGGVLVAAALLATACAGPKSGAAATPVTAPATLVSVVPVQEATIGQTQTLTGSVTAQDSLAVTPRQAGRLVTFPLKVGQTVQAGDIVAALDHSQADLTLESQQAALESAKAKLASEQAGPKPCDGKR